MITQLWPLGEGRPQVVVHSQVQVPNSAPPEISTAARAVQHSGQQRHVQHGGHRHVQQVLVQVQLQARRVQRLPDVRVRFVFRDQLQQLNSLLKLVDIPPSCSGSSAQSCPDALLVCVESIQMVEI
mgnify:CR=1 FL=1